MILKADGMDVSIREANQKNVEAFGLKLIKGVWSNPNTLYPC